MGTKNEDNNKVSQNKSSTSSAQNINNNSKCSPECMCINEENKTLRAQLSEFSQRMQRSEAMLSKTDNTQAGTQSVRVGYQPASSILSPSRIPTPSSDPGPILAASGQATMITLKSIYAMMQRMLCEMDQLNIEVKESTIVSENLERRMRKVKFGSRKRVGDESSSPRIKAARRINNMGDVSDAAA